MMNDMVRQGHGIIQKTHKKDGKEKVSNYDVPHGKGLVFFSDEEYPFEADYREAFLEAEDAHSVGRLQVFAALHEGGLVITSDPTDVTNESGNARAAFYDTDLPETIIYVRSDDKEFRGILGEDIADAKRKAASLEGLLNRSRRKEREG